MCNSLIAALGSRCHRRRVSATNALMGLACATVMCLALLVVGTSIAYAEPLCTDTWVGPASGNWSAGANWSTGLEPGEGGVACIGVGNTVEVTAAGAGTGVLDDEGSLVIAGGSLNVSDTVEVSSVKVLTLSGGGVLKGAGTVDVTGSLAAAGGTMEGSGQTVLASAATGLVKGAGLIVAERKLDIAGSMLIEGASSTVGEDGAQIINSGTLTVNAEGGSSGMVVGTKGSRPSLENTGTLRKSEGTGNSEIGFTVDNEATVNVESGTLTFSGGGSSGGTNADTWSVAASTQIVFAHDVFKLGSEVSLSGTGRIELVEEAEVTAGKISGTTTAVAVTSGALKLTGASTSMTIAELTVSSGEVSIANGDSLIAPILSVVGGRLTSGESTTINSESELYMRGGAFDVGNASQVSSGEVFIGGGEWRSGENVHLHFGYFLDSPYASFTSSVIWGPKTTVEASGRIAMTDSVLGVGSSSLVKAEQLDINKNATATLQGTLIVQDLIMGGDVLELNGAAEAESFAWESSGTVSGTGSITAAFVTLQGEGAVHNLDGPSVTSTGFGGVEEGTLEMANGAVLETRRYFKANTETSGRGAQIKVAEGSTTPPRIINRGEFVKEAASGTTEVSVQFANWGLVRNLSKGRLVIDGAVLAPPAEQYGAGNPSALGGGPRPACGDPINCITGNFYETQQDISVSGRGANFGLARTYNAQAAAKGEHGVFGYGWTSSLSDHVVYSESAKTATVVQANGSTVSFSEESGSWKAPVWTQDKLTGNASEGYTLTLADQTVYKFAASGRLESVADRNGNTTSLGYNEKGQLATITDPSGRTIRLAYNSEGLVESATDPMGHTVKYAYESGSLAGVTLPEQSSPRWQFKYDASHRMTSMVNGIGGETTNTYNSNNQVVSQKNPAGHTLKWEYEPFKTKITNESTGSVTLEEYTSADKVNAITHGYGTEHATTESFTYNEAGEPLTHTDGNGHTTIYEYSGGGDRVKQTDPEGHETKWSYNAQHEITSETLPSGEKTSIEYDEHGNPIKVSRPAPKEETQETRYEYNAHGEMTTMIDPVGGKWAYEYDEAGDRTGETDPEGDKTTWGYNEDSQNTSEVSPAGNIEGGKPAEYTSTIERNALGQTVKITRPEGKETSYEYNADGDQTAATDANGHKTEVSYNSEDNPIKVSQPSGATQETEYDGAGQIIKQTDGDKHVTSYVRDVLGQVTEETNPLEHKTKKTYDAAGNLATVTDAAGRTTTYGYNKENRLTKISYSEAGTHTVEYEYTPDGQLASMSDGTGTSSYAYDQLGRLTETKDGHGDVVGYGYDLANEITSVTYPNGKTIKDGYDKAGRLSSVSDWLSHTTSFSYTPDSRVATESFPEASGDSDHYAYSRAGELAETKMLKGAETLAQLLYKRDRVGQVTNATQTGLPGEASTEYAYTTNEQLEKAGSTGYEYDPAGNPTKIGAATNTFNAADQLTEGGGVTYTYNEVGQRTKATPTSGPATSYSYDQAGNLTSVARPEAGETAKIEDSYTYNGNDLRASETINGTTSYLSWQQTGALPLLLSEGSNSYIYGPDGTPIEQINSEEHATYLHHDQAGSTRLLTNEKGETVGSYSYTPYGAIEKHEGTATTALGYDGQYTSPDTGLIYMRARVYDPATAQFLSVDPLVAESRMPYAYAGDNPVNASDPRGLLCGLDFIEAGPSCSEIGQAIGEGAKAVGQGLEATEHFVAEHAGTIASVTGVAAIVFGAAGVEPVAAALIAVSAAAGTYAAGQEAAKGEYMQAALDALASALGGTAKAEDLLAALEREHNLNDSAEGVHSLANILDGLGDTALAASLLNALGAEC
jgi:RHS repeat-associated protein